MRVLWNKVDGILLTAKGLSLVLVADRAWYLALRAGNRMNTVQFTHSTHRDTDRTLYAGAVIENSRARCRLADDGTNGANKAS